MQIEPALLVPAWQLATTLVALPVLLHAFVTAPWASWFARPDRQHAWLGTLVLLIVVWSMRAGITPGLSFQFLLVGALTLMHGPRLALVGVAVVLAAECAVAGGWAPWTAWAANFLCAGVVPVACVALVHRAVERWLPHDYFVYVFATAFCGSMLAFHLAGIARLWLLDANGALAHARLAGEYFAYLPLVGLAEAFVNGIVMATAVVYRPDWVATFDDRVYLRR